MTEDRFAALKEKRRAYYLATREARIAYGKAYYQANKDKLKEAPRAKLKALREAKTEERRLAREAHREARRAAKARRRYQAKNDPVLACPLVKTVLTVIKENRKLFQTLSGVPQHIDHIIPLCKGGTDAPWNLRIITAEENMARPRQTFEEAA